MAGFLSLVALSVIPLAAFGRPTSHLESSNCTDASSKSASWIIRNFTADTNTRFSYGPGTAGKVSFSIQNTANGYDFDCLQGDGSTGRVPNRYLENGQVWYSCNVYCKGARGEPVESDPDLETSFHFDVESKSLSISQSWGCTSSGWNASIPTNYTATGTSVISNLTCSQVPGGRSDQVACAPVDFVVKASNVSVVVSNNSTDDSSDDGGDSSSSGGSSPAGNPFVPQIYPLPAILPSTAGCSKLSQSASFQVSNFFWSAGGVYFTLKNTALNYTQSCNLGGFQGQTVGGTGGPGSYTDQGSLADQSWWNCTTYDPMHVDYPANGVYTTLLYGGNSDNLGINQTWYCDDEDPANPTVYSVFGEADFPLKCTETRDCIPANAFDDDQSPTKVVSDTCLASDATIAPKVVSTSHLTKDQAIEEFKPHGFNCSSKSLEPQTWDITGFSFNRTYVPPRDDTPDSKSGYTDRIEFSYNNTATDNDWPRNTGWRQCLFISDETEGDLDGEKQLSCMRSFEPFQLGFKFDNKTSALTLSQGWWCDGNDTAHTNFFTAVGSVQLNLQCETVVNDTICLAARGLAVPMTSMTSQLNSNESSGYTGIV